MFLQLINEEYNRKSNVNFIKPLHYLGNIFGVVPFYDFKRRIRTKRKIGKIYGILLIAVHIYSFYGFIVGMELKENGNILFGSIFFALYSFMSLTSIISIFIFSIIHGNTYVKLLNKIEKVDSRIKCNEKSDYCIFELLIANILIIFISFYDYPNWYSFGLPIWYIVWDFFLGYSFRITIYLMYNFAIGLKYRYEFLNKFIKSLHAENSVPEDVYKIVEIYHNLNELVNLFNKLFELPFVMYMPLYTFYVLNTLKTIISNSIVSILSFTAYDLVRIYHFCFYFSHFVSSSSSL